jgi:hypothetical protein
VRRSRGRPAALALLAAIGCSPPPPDGPERTAAELETARAARYRDVEETFTTEQDQNRWFELKRALQRDFDDICGDTFCEGDFSNLASLSFRCSVSVRGNQLESCLWLFAGSYETVTPSTGSVRPTAKFFPCAIPLQGTPAAVMDALLAPGGRGALWNAMPGGTRSIYDVLGACL